MHIHFFPYLDDKLLLLLVDRNSDLQRFACFHGRVDHLAVAQLFECIGCVGYQFTVKKRAIR